MSKKVLIIGAGLGSLATALRLTTHGYEVEIIEKYHQAGGRLNQLNFLINRPGLFYGQCSEICGTNHRFIPICVERINLNYFFK